MIHFGGEVTEGGSKVMRQLTCAHRLKIRSNSHAHRWRSSLSLEERPSLEELLHEIYHSFEELSREGRPSLEDSHQIDLTHI